MFWQHLFFEIFFNVPFDATEKWIINSYTLWWVSSYLHNLLLSLRTHKPQGSCESIRGEKKQLLLAPTKLSFRPRCTLLVFLPSLEVYRICQRISTNHLHCMYSITPSLRQTSVETAEDQKNLLLRKQSLALLIHNRLSVENKIFANV